MQQINNLLKLPEQKKVRSQRADVLSQIIEVYRDPKEDISRKRLNMSIFIAYCKKYHLRWKDQSTQTEFKRSKIYLKPLTDTRIAVALSKLNLKDLYYVLSVCKDRLNRSENVGAYIITCTRELIKK